jgi:hypothetical protein
MKPDGHDVAVGSSLARRSCSLASCPATTRTLRGAASQIAKSATKLETIPSEKAGT